MAQINPAQDYDMVQTLTFEAASGTCKIRLYRGGTIPINETVFYRAGTSGAWTSLAVSSNTTTTFPVLDTVMQVAHNWQISVFNHMTSSFTGNSTNLISIEISQKAALGNQRNQAFRLYASGCSALTYLDVPDFSAASTFSTDTMTSYAVNCSLLTEFTLPEVPNLTSAINFMSSGLFGCSGLQRINLGSVGYYALNNLNFGVPAGLLGTLKGNILNEADIDAWSGLTEIGNTLYTNYIRSTDDLLLNGEPLPSLGGTAAARRALLLGM